MRLLTPALSSFGEERETERARAKLYRYKRGCCGLQTRCPKTGPFRTFFGAFRVLLSEGHCPN